MSIQHANEAALRRHSALRSRRYPIELVDSWVNEVETLIEHKNRVVPEPLITEIAGFLGQTDTRIYRPPAKKWQARDRDTTGNPLRG